MRNLSIRWQLWLASIFILLAIVGVLVLSQLSFVSRIYEDISTTAMRVAANNISDTLKEDEISVAFAKTDDISREKWITCRIFDANGNLYVPKNKAGEKLHYAEYMVDSPLFRLSELPDDARKYVDYADENGGTFFTTDPIVVDGQPVATGITSLLYSKRVELAGEEGYYYLMLNAYVGAGSETIDTIKLIFIFVAVLMLVVVTTVSFYLSNQLSRPIVEINDASKQLAKGNYDVRFTEKGYLEISELGRNLNYAAKELKKTESLQKELIANISHDLRTPLTMIIGYSEMMRDLPSENTPDNMNVIIDEAKRLSTLVSDLLDLSRINSGVDSLNKTVFCITDCVSDILDRFNQFNESRGFKIEFEYSSKVRVEGDIKRIAQVVYNLVNNAIVHAGDDRTVVVKQRLRGNVVRIEVRDNGIGIPKEQLDEIWERYYKLDRNDKSVKSGSGIGLSIVKAVLTAHRAKFGVDSEVGKGTTFWFEMKTFTL